MYAYSVAQRIMSVMTVTMSSVRPNNEKINDIYGNRITKLDLCMAVHVAIRYNSFSSSKSIPQRRRDRFEFVHEDSFSMQCVSLQHHLRTFNDTFGSLSMNDFVIIFDGHFVTRCPSQPIGRQVKMRAKWNAYESEWDQAIRSTDEKIQSPNMFIMYFIRVATRGCFYDQSRNATSLSFQWILIHTRSCRHVPKKNSFSTIKQCP